MKARLPTIVKVGLIILLAAAIPAAAQDLDRDGLPDTLEQSLLDRFAPTLLLARGECDTAPASFVPFRSDPIVKAKDGSLVLLDNTELKDAKTKALIGHIEGLGLTSALIIDGAEVNTGFAQAARNIPYVDVLPVQGINVYDILRRQKLVLTKAAIDALEARFK